MMQSCPTIFFKQNVSSCRRLIILISTMAVKEMCLTFSERRNKKDPPINYSPMKTKWDEQRTVAAASFNDIESAETLVRMRCTSSKPGRQTCTDNLHSHLAFWHRTKQKQSDPRASTTPPSRAAMAEECKEPQAKHMRVHGQCQQAEKEHMPRDQTDVANELEAGSQKQNTCAYILNSERLSSTNTV